VGGKQAITLAQVIADEIILKRRNELRR